MMGLRKVRNEVTTVRKEGVARNGTEKVIFFPPIPCQRHPVRIWSFTFLRLQPLNIAFSRQLDICVWWSMKCNNKLLQYV